MFPTLARLSKASRAPLTPKRGNKDFYKGTRQAYLPGGRRTGAPGKHVIRGKAKYRLIDEKVRCMSHPLRAYVAMNFKITPDQEHAVFSKFRGPRGLTPEHFLRVAREHTYAQRNPDAPAKDLSSMPAWIQAQVKLGLMKEPLLDGVPLSKLRPKKQSAEVKKHFRELEVVSSPSSS
ncbi:hypothetical protein BDZ97DRAFT_1827745 [Flammula alnicola]|nr:hypothetical protein BDZ97DRAFT_1827745 [Flammula alnicola]